MSPRRTFSIRSFGFLAEIAVGEFDLLDPEYLSVSALSDSSLKFPPSKIRSPNLKSFSIRSFGFLAEMPASDAEIAPASGLSVSALSDSSLKFHSPERPHLRHRSFQYPLFRIPR